MNYLSFSKYYTTDGNEIPEDFFLYEAFNSNNNQFNKLLRSVFGNKK